MIGFHVILDLYDCNAAALTDKKLVKETLCRAAAKGGLTLLGSVFHEFEPNGVSGALLLAESHLCIHTWPESGYAAVDLFTCKKDTDIDGVEECVKSMLKAGRCRRTDMRRGTEIRGRRSNA